MEVLDDPRKGWIKYTCRLGKDDVLSVLKHQGISGSLTTLKLMHIRMSREEEEVISSVQVGKP
jgi:hypothetical protein